MRKIFFLNPNGHIYCILVLLQSYLLTFVVKLLKWGKKFAFKIQPCLKGGGGSQIRAHVLDGVFILSFLEKDATCSSNARLISGFA